MKKLILISIAIILGLAALVVTSVFLYRHVQPVKETESSAYVPTEPSSTLSPDSTKQEAQTTPDLSKDLGACNVTSVDAINAMLNTSAQPANNRGIAHIRGGEAQSCVYSLSQDDVGSNRVTITVTDYATSDAQNQAATGYSAYTPVGGVGEQAYFLTSANGTIYTLAVLKDQKSVEFMLTVPSSTNPFTDSLALDALKALAQKSTF